MHKFAVKVLIVVFLLTGAVGFSALAVSPLLPNVLGNCVTEKFEAKDRDNFQDSYKDDNPEKLLANIYNECSVLPQSISIIVAGLGLVGLLFLLKQLAVVTLKPEGIALTAIVYMALELLFYMLVQHNYFYESQMAVDAGAIAQNYLFAWSSLISLAIALVLVPRLLRQKLFSEKI